jgi:two-component system sensor histidine kinase VicK
MADPARITQVFDNLLENAIKFSPERGVIRVRLRAAQEVVRVEISDQGIGISADRIDQIFDRFYQIDGSATRRFGGVGLGLAICKQIISAHKGEIEVQSEEGVGSTFLFSIPLATADIPTRRPPYVR